MDFQHSDAIWRDFPGLVPGVVFADGIKPDVAAADRAASFTAIARSRLAGVAESELPEIRAWRQAFARMGLKPTQYRCASEALLRRLRQEGSLPQLHPLVDLANAVSVAFAIPVAVFDVDRVAGSLQVRFADGTERYQSFSGELENPPPGEVVFRDDDGWAHARRWTNRQSGRSAVRGETSRVLIVTEGVHAAAGDDVPRLVEALAAAVETAWGGAPRRAILSTPGPRFALEPNRRS
jgi:DNA/RNA-binding domain of Phe-tRNA-synthetase-like protein